MNVGVLANVRSISVPWLRVARHALFRAALALAACCWASVILAQQTAAIATAHPLATAAGYEILKRGGNAFDAGVAVAAALAVVEPYSSGLGGGGFWLLHRADDGHQVMVDARETAPAGVRREHYFDRDGKPIPGATRQGGLAAAIPGAPAALAHVATRYGALPLSVSLAPAIQYARAGFKIDPRYARIARLRERFLQKGTGTARIFLDGMQAPQPGYVLRQPELAATLERLAREGASGFYSGRVGRALAAAVNEAGGVWQHSDLESYRVVERAPIRFTYRGATITAAALPSAGGIALAQSLGMLERFPSASPGNPGHAHLVVEALRRAFQDRARYLGDSDFKPVPVTKLLDRRYIARRAATIDPGAATKSDALGDEQPVRSESGNTTHFSVIDEAGNRVAATLTINLLFGAGIVAGDTGVLLNNEMDDFSLGDDVPNAYRLRGGRANGIEPGKRPLSSMTPAFVEDERGVLILGSPGGSRTVSQVLLAILQYLHASRVDLPRLLALPRFHHQYWPDRVEIEPEGFTPAWRAALAAKGHTLETVNRKWGNMQVVFKSKQTGAAHAASDPRGADVAWY
ncbi:MAG: gamma-glutamyltransferase [Betaproteobacteria bacterium]|nr:gamma-glutamyltransferase [Betaproteobacteria bacterium]